MQISKERRFELRGSKGKVPEERISLTRPQNGKNTSVTAVVSEGAVVAEELGAFNRDQIV